jgi:chromatin remodeling complex protein RSC6
MAHEEVILLDETTEPGLNQFDGLIFTLSSFKTQITVLQQQLRTIEKNMNKEIKGLRKDAQKIKQNRLNRKPSGFAKPSKISAELCIFMGREPDTEVARTEVTKYIINYIREHALQNVENRKIILPDDSLKKLLDSQESDNITYFNLQQYMNKHFHKKAAV